MRVPRSVPAPLLIAVVVLGAVGGAGAADGVGAAGSVTPRAATVNPSPRGGSTSARGTYGGFGAPEPVAIEGYSGSAMEPFISPDGQYLLFNTSNVSPDIPALQYGSRIDAQTFTYEGAVQGTNESGVVSGTPSLDDQGNIYFVSNRSYAQTMSTVYTGLFASGQVTDVHLVPGISGGSPGIVDFDASVSPDGSTLYVSVGQFSGSVPTTSHISIFDKEQSGFVLDPKSSRLLRAVNRKKMLDYAAAVSADGLELFFTRITSTGGAPSIYRAVRTKIGRPFGHVEQVAAISGFAEAPSISADGSTLYYHLLVGNQFDVESVVRSPTASARTHRAVRPRTGPQVDTRGTM